jgi:hypothetical protein
MELINNYTIQTFIPNNVVSFKNIQITKTIKENDSFKKYEATTEVKGEYIVCNDITKLKQHHTNNNKRETYEQYLVFLSNRDIEIDRWIYNIIDGIAEQDKILFKDDNMIIIPTYIWDSQNIEKLHILCLPTNKSIRTIRELTKEHISLLESMKQTTLKVINEKYGLKEESLNMFFHYEPSTYHLHIHFVNVNHNKYKKSLYTMRYSHDLDTVIFNLKIDSDYYKKIRLNRRT